MGKPEPQTIRLSRRHAQIVVLSAKSLSHATICEVLGIKKGTLYDHFAVIRERVGSTSRPELTMLALAMGWVDNPYEDMAGSIICDQPPDV